MKLKEFDESVLSQRDHSLWEQAIIARKDCFQWEILRVYASMVQNTMLEDLLIQESNIMHSTMMYFDNEGEEECQK